MKKILSLLSLAALTVGLLGSCSKINDRIDNLEKKVDGIESNQIASIKSQVDAINTSIADLGTIRQNVQTLINTTPSKEDIEELRKADEALGRRIDELKSYTDGELTKYATTEWVKATFATLEQYQWTCDTIAKIDARIGALDAKLSQSISGLESSLKQWVNEQLDAYYTAAQMDAKLGVMQAEIDALKNSKDSERIDSLATELTKTKVAVDSAKTNIRSEYKAAVQSAIETSEGKLTQALKDSIAKVNNKITALDTRVTSLEDKVLALEGNVNKLLAMIQSVSITPAYSDGSVEAVDGILTLKCIVSPAEALTGMQSLKDSLLIYADSVKVKTKATTPAYMAIKVSEASALDAAQGAITLTADISEYLPKGEDKALTVAVNIKNGISDFTTEFVPVTLAAPAPLPAGALKGVFSVSATKKVHFSKGNLQYVVAGKTWGFYENQYDFCNAKIYSGHHSDTISLFTWGYDATKSIIPDGKDSDNVSITSGNLSPEQDWGCTVGDGKTWRTLTTEEWQYLFSDKSRYGFATVGGVNGIIILPDTFADPMRNGGSGAFIPNKTGYDTNVYTAGGNWEAMESAGAVFLSAAGYRNGSSIGEYIGFVGYYWSSTARSGGVNAFDVTFNEYQVIANSFTNGRSYGKSVRLVTEVK